MVIYNTYGKEIKAMIGTLSVLKRSDNNYKWVECNVRENAKRIKEKYNIR